MCLIEASRRLVLPFEQNQRGDEEAAACACHEDDGVAVGSLCGWRRGGGVVAALRAALCEGRDGA